ncbi:MAG TPA: amidohydrolase family protein [Planctomycetaceae bacterium]|jgi:predicted TIM-barrel fold metal-dependent hydrolase
MPKTAIDRRTWMIGSLSGLVGLRLSTLVAADSKSDLDIIDCHTHFYDPTRPAGIPWPQPGTPLYRPVLPKHLRELKQFRRVTGTVIVEASPRLEDNAWLLELAQDDPFIVGIVGHLDPGTPDFAKHVKRFTANPLFRGIRVSSNLVQEFLKKGTFTDLKLLADHDLALDVNGGPDTPALVARLAKELPPLRIVQNHIGNVRITAEAPPRDWQEGIRAAASQPNVYCKISALVEGAARDGKKAPGDLAFYRPYIDVVWNAFGAERVIYGSDWPVSESAADYETMQRIVMEYAFEKGDKATRDFCSLSAKRAYKWIERPGRR